MGYHNRKQVKIRKPHLCHGCEKRHEVGETMEANSGVSDGFGRYSYHLCLDCAPVSVKYWREIEMDGAFEYGIIREIMLERSVQTHAELGLCFDAERARKDEATRREITRLSASYGKEKI